MGANALIDAERGIVSRELFVNEDVYQQEQERIFARTWLFVGHESQVPQPGDFFGSYMGSESVILTRDRQHRLHVLLNTCRHRGMRVCRYDQGNTTTFYCPYHGWSYGLDGELVGVPEFKEGYHEKLDRSQWGLVEVPQMVVYKGSVWATWDPDAPPFLDYLGGMRFFLDLLLDCRDGREGGSQVLGGVQKWQVPCNWKFGAENFVGDAYHAISHRSVDAVGIAPSGGKGRTDKESSVVMRYAVSFEGLGHGTNTNIHPRLDEPYTPIFTNFPHLQDYFRQAHEARRKRYGERSRFLGGAATIFPNMSFQPRQPRSIAVWHPRGPGQTEIWRWYLVDADAPQELKDYLNHYHVSALGPAGMTEQDDMENWNYATAASRGVIARRYPYNYEMGLGFESTADPLPELPGATISNIPSEKNQRAYYRRWAELMSDSR
ncbi:MAG TPA: Rieske 2Fe-2S domain-containing protein [Chloroflexota bacterium]|nr:Rieske 2Fe-2S domain-containing protein [Chloroflexota bacterium]